LLSACGGGGGGTTPPGPGGGGGPTPTPTSSGSPGSTPTPHPSGSPMSTPTPHATNTPSSTPTPNTILPNSTGAVDPMQIIDLKMSQQDIDDEAPYEDLVWGAFFPQYWNQAPGRNP